MELKASYIAAIVVFLIAKAKANTSSFEFQDEQFAFLRKMKLLRGQPLELCLCPLIYLPVCGTDGKIYSNFCSANCKSMGVQCLNKCPCKTEETEKTFQK